MSNIIYAADLCRLEYDPHGVFIGGEECWGEMPASDVLATISKKSGHDHYSLEIGPSRDPNSYWVYSYCTGMPWFRVTRMSDSAPSIARVTHIGEFAVTIG